MSSLHLVLRRAGGLYALPAGDVSELRQRHSSVDLRFAGVAVAADAVAGLARDLACRAAGAVWRRFLPAGGVALALWEQEPVLVLDSSGPIPAPLAIPADGAPAPVAPVASDQAPGKDTAA